MPGLPERLDLLMFAKNFPLFYATAIERLQVIYCALEIVYRKQKFLAAFLQTAK